jgi:hypothetical protein
MMLSVSFFLFFNWQVKDVLTFFRAAVVKFCFAFIALDEENMTS